MNQNIKLGGALLLSLILGTAAVYGWQTFTQQDQEKLATVSSPTPFVTPVTSPLSTPTITPTPTPVVKPTGSISGSLGFPSEGIPPLFIYAFKQDDQTVYYKTATLQNQTTFTLSDLPTGVYVVVAYPQDTANLGGGYTKAVPCGLTVACTDHSLIPVTVTAGQTTSGVEIKDWYVPEGTFPSP